jgi:hypothetical protein
MSGVVGAILVIALARAIIQGEYKIRPYKSFLEGVTGL